jgi:hypothetical protein
MTVLQTRASEAQKTETVCAAPEPPADPAIAEAAAAVLAAAQTLRRAVQHASAPSAPTLATLEATLDSLGVSIAELRRPLLGQLASRHPGQPGSRAAQLDGARQVGAATHHLGEAAAACGELRMLLSARGL